MEERATRRQAPAAIERPPEAANARQERPETQGVPPRVHVEGRPHRPVTERVVEQPPHCHQARVGNQRQHAPAKRSLLPRQLPGGNVGESSQSRLTAAEARGERSQREDQVPLRAAPPPLHVRQHRQSSEHQTEQRVAVGEPTRGHGVCVLHREQQAGHSCHHRLPCTRR